MWLKWKSDNSEFDKKIKNLRVWKYTRTLSGRKVTQNEAEWPTVFAALCWVSFKCRYYFRLRLRFVDEQTTLRILFSTLWVYMYVVYFDSLINICYTLSLKVIRYKLSMLIFPLGKWLKWVIIIYNTNFASLNCVSVWQWQIWICSLLTEQIYWISHPIFYRVF